MGLRNRDRIRTAVCENDLEAALLQGTLQRSQVQLVVIDQQPQPGRNRRFRGHACTIVGNSKDTSTPGPSAAACMDNDPPRRSTVACDSARPMPMPSGLWVRNSLEGS